MSKSNIKSTKDGLVELSSRKKIISPLEEHKGFPDKLPDMTDTVICLLEEEHFTIGEGFRLLRQIEQRLQDKAYACEI